MAASAVKSGSPALRVDPQETFMLMASPPSPLKRLAELEEHPLSRSQQLQPGANQDNPRGEGRRESRSRAILEIARQALAIKNTDPYETISPHQCFNYRRRLLEATAIGFGTGAIIGTGLTAASAGFGAPTIPVLALGGAAVGFGIEYYIVRQDIKKGFNEWVENQSTENLQRFNQLFDESYNHFREGNKITGRLMIIPMRGPKDVVMDYSTWKRAVERRQITNAEEWRIDYKRMGITHQTIQQLIENGVVQKEGERMDPLLLEGLRVLEADIKRKIDLCFKMEEQRFEQKEKEKQISRKDRYAALLSIAKDFEPELT